ncbi:MAG: hypothetical protein JSU85_15540 [Candidatus Zixiibacteriota bacterium]|nr:MAG: hypothetical protein JSU85_15540 [candidate division Zixibacteria bacterium]
MKKRGYIHILKIIILILTFPLLAATCFQKNQVFAFEYYYHGQLKWSDSPVAKGLGGCEINLTDRYASLTNPAMLGISHLKRRISVSFPNNYQLGSENSTDMELKSHSVSIGFPLTVEEMKFGLGIAYSRKNSKSFNVFSIAFPISYSTTYIERAECYSVGISFIQNARIGFGYTLKQLDSWFYRQWLPDEKYKRDKYKVHDIGFYFDFPISESENLKYILRKIDKGNIKHDIIPSIAFVRSNIGSKFLNPYSLFENRALAQIDKLGLSISFISGYKNAEIFSFRMIREFNMTHGRVGIDFSRAGIEIGAGGTFYMRAGFWNTEAFDGKIWTYGLGLNIGGLANILYATGKIRTVNPIAQYILKNISISADFAMERCDDESEYEDSDYFKICFSL